MIFFIPKPWRKY